MSRMNEHFIQERERMAEMTEMNGQITEQELDALAELIPAEPAMRRDIVLAMLRVSAEQEQQVELQEVEVQTERKPSPPRYVLQKRWDIRLRDWLLTQAAQPKRLARWLSWWIALPWRVGSFVRTIAGGKIRDPFEIAEREAICERCDQRYVFIRLNGKQSDHCQACKCPPTRWSALDYKNQLANWHCPLRKHPGPYPNDGQAVALKGLGYEENAVLSAVGGGCTGCGCGKATR